MHSSTTASIFKLSRKINTFYSRNAYKSLSRNKNDNATAARSLTGYTSFNFPKIFSIEAKQNFATHSDL